MIQTCLQRFVTQPVGAEEIFLRGADDFLFISSDHSRAKQFLNITREGLPSYNCFFQASKKMSNLDNFCQVIPIPFCGSLLNIRHREVSPNYCSYAHSNVFHTQTGPKEGV